MKPDPEVAVTNATQAKRSPIAMTTSGSSLLPAFLFVAMLLLPIGLLPAQDLESIEPRPDDRTLGTQILPAPATVQVPPPPANLSVPAFDPSITTLHRIKDITFPEGDRNNVVSGVGLVVGLSGTGGRATQTQTMAQNYFFRNGISTVAPLTLSMSAVIVRGTIPAYARRGEVIQVTVAVADDASSLRGGHLVETVLKGFDGQIYAVADGPVLGGGIAAGGAAANVQRDHPTVGVCEAIIEREVCHDRMPIRDRIRLILRNKEYSTAVSVANAVNLAFPGTAQALDSGTIEIQVPRSYQVKLPDFISVIGQLRVTVDQRARVVVNQKTGTIVMGQNVRISNVVFAHENLIISQAETPVAAQPAPFSQGETVVLPRTTVDVLETGGRYSSLNSTTVGELGRALNALGVSPNTMITIFASLRNQGALQAELIIE